MFLISPVVKRDLTAPHLTHHATHLLAFSRKFLSPCCWIYSLPYTTGDSSDHVFKAGSQERSANGPQLSLILLHSVAHTINACLSYWESGFSRGFMKGPFYIMLKYEGLKFLQGKCWLMRDRIWEEMNRYLYFFFYSFPQWNSLHAIFPNVFLPVLLHYITSG